MQRALPILLVGAKRSRLGVRKYFKAALRRLAGWERRLLRGCSQPSEGEELWQRQFIQAGRNSKSFGYLFGRA